MVDYEETTNNQEYDLDVYNDMVARNDLDQVAIGGLIPAEPHKEIDDLSSEIIADLDNFLIQAEGFFKALESYLANVRDFILQFNVLL